MFFQSTAIPFRTPITDIRRPGQGRAEFLEVVLAVKVTLGAEATFFKAACGVRAERRDGTIAAVGAIIKRFSEAAGFLEKHMVTDFF